MEKFFLGETPIYYSSIQPSVKHLNPKALKQAHYQSVQKVNKYICLNPYDKVNSVKYQAIKLGNLMQKPLSAKPQSRQNPYILQNTISVPVFSQTPTISDLQSSYSLPTMQTPQNHMQILSPPPQNNSNITSNMQSSPYNMPNIQNFYSFSNSLSQQQNEQSVLLEPWQQTQQTKNQNQLILEQQKNIYYQQEFTEKQRLQKEEKEKSERLKKQNPVGYAVFEMQYANNQDAGMLIFSKQFLPVPCPQKIHKRVMTLIIQEFRNMESYIDYDFDSSNILLKLEKSQASYIQSRLNQIILENCQSFPKWSWLTDTGQFQVLQIKNAIIIENSFNKNAEKCQIQTGEINMTIYFGTSHFLLKDQDAFFRQVKRENSDQPQNPKILPASKWEWEDDEQFKLLSPELSEILEHIKNLNKQGYLFLSENRQIHFLNLQDMNQTNQSTGKKSQIRRVIDN